MQYEEWHILMTCRKWCDMTKQWWKVNKVIWGSELINIIDSQCNIKL